MIKANQCPRCKGSIGIGWLYCRNTINDEVNTCGWKEGQSHKYSGEIRKVFELLYPS